jgi:uncharacterized protein (TIGR02996 family)
MAARGRRRDRRDPRERLTGYNRRVVSELEDLLAACVASPDDDAPRLVWADAIGGERGEFVVVQCRLARAELTPAERGVLIARHDELLLAHGIEWSGFARGAGVKQCQFRRGFVEAIEADVTRLPLSRLFQQAPLLVSVHVRGIGQDVDYREADKPATPHPVDMLRQLIAQPELQRLRGIEIDEARLYETTGDTEWHFDSTSYADQVLELIASSGKLAGFRGLAIHDTFTERGMHELLGSNALAALEALAFRFGKADALQVRELCEAAPRLRSLDLHHAIDVATIADHIPASVVELSACMSGDDLEKLAASPIAATLERLDVQGRLDPELLAAFPRLRSLVMRYTQASDQIGRLVRTPLASLRELSLPSEITDALPVAEAFGQQLDCLDVRGNDKLTGQTDELRQRVAGYVRANDLEFPWNKVASVTTDKPMQVGINTREPWIRYGLLPF